MDPLPHSRGRSSSTSVDSERGVEQHSTADPLDAGRELRCVRCGKGLVQRRSVRLQAKNGMVWKCMRCGSIDGMLVARSARVALVVGTALILLNQGDQLWSGVFPWASSWYKIPLTYLVPFCVATYGALSNGYRGAKG